MRFVPIAGTKVLFSIWDTRVQDYSVYAEETRMRWGKASFDQGPTHPAVKVSWEYAKTFCAWLTEKERKEGKIGGKQFYRLPTDEEWSFAVGLGPEAGSTPSEKSGKIRDNYPWGTEWPIPHGAGNYGVNLEVDEFNETSPVGSFAVNKNGLYDMGGNVWQWCEDWYDGSQTSRVLRGASWLNGDPGSLPSASRNFKDPVYSAGSTGFRCVLVGASSR
jgi:formylglycine-generating enzyme required for sulfatase activity